MVWIETPLFPYWWVARGQMTVVLNIFCNFKTILVFELEEKFGFNTISVRRAISHLKGFIQ